ncbi:rhodanese-like domain-containing protein [Romboutsia sedimentorum]|uniref:Rhodanese-like domain-containing protein n=1 Tax=Romboutsia sedimentorum TaxID=1368474 RepID=A0ABT7E6M0_9FIRM|nr:rhodanese-like domain-containing protein [Romboutsia sedimentorum]MDK2562578.1 rhodanese-like domain-containing protein [Romboutsia sedimentorum]MDK2584820.1 rhodanese-like domain-containing protein [Romboutsia sedimentorum]
MNYININNENLKELIKDDILLLDIRTKEEYEEKNIPNSINIQLNDLLYNIDEIEEYKNKKIVVYCRSGHRSITACNLLSMEGFTNLYNLEKGIINYKL